MTRKKKDRVVWQYHFNLSSDNEADVRLHDFLTLLAEDGKAAQWVRDQLHNIVLLHDNSNTTVLQRNESIEPDEALKSSAQSNGMQPATPRYPQEARPFSKAEQVGKK